MLSVQEAVVLLTAFVLEDAQGSGQLGRVEKEQLEGAGAGVLGEGVGRELVGKGGLRVVVQEQVGAQTDVGEVIIDGEQLREGGDRQGALGEKDVWLWELI